MGSKRKAPGEARKKRTVAREEHDHSRPAEKSESIRTATASGGQKGVDERTGSAKTRSSSVRMPSFSLKPDLITLLLAGVLLVALAVRMLPILYSWVGGHVLFAEFDPYYHMRRIVYSVEHFPAVNSYDSYVNYPYGYVVGWPPLFDLIAAAFSLVVGLGNPGRSTIEVASALVPVLMGLGAIVVAYLLVKDTINRKAALFTSLVMAIMLGAVYKQVFAYVNHQVLEVLISLTMYLLFMRGVSSARAGGLSFSGIMGHKKPLAYALLAGVAIAATIFSWDGAAVYIGVLAAYAFVQYAYDAYRKESSEYLTVVGLIASVAAFIIVAPFAATSDAGRSFMFSFVLLSWFHIVFLLSLAIFFAALGLLYKAALGRKVPWYSIPLASLAALALAVVGIRLALPGLYATLQSGVEFLTGGNTILSAIQEITPLFSYNGEFSWLVPWTYFSVAGILAAIGLVAYLLIRLPGKKITNAEIFLLVWTAIVLALGLLQQRFVYLLAVNVAVFAGYLVYEAFELSGLLKPLDAEKAPGRKKEPAKPAGITPPMVAVLIVAAMALIPVLYGSVSFNLTNPFYYTTDWNLACQWVDANTPKTDFTYSADQGTEPQYGVMSWWDYGNYILYAAERPAVANNFQTGIPDAAHFFIAQDEPSADAVMDKVKARYVMVDHRQGLPEAGVYDGIFINMPTLGGDDPNSYVMRYTVPMPGNSTMQYDASGKYYESMYSRLFNGDGLGGRDPLGYVASGLQRYRLLYMTEGIDPVKVFEYVKGATINGSAAPGAKVELRLNVTTHEGDRTYYSSTVAGPDGAYSFTVPYPTADRVGTVTTGAAYTIASGASSLQVQVPESAVDSGEAIAAGGKL